MSATKALTSETPSGANVVFVRSIRVTEPPLQPGNPGGRAGSDLTDVDLVEALHRRDSSAVDVLYARYGRPAYSLARRITSDPGFAEDVVQEVFLALWRDPAKFDRSRGGFGSWLLSMTHHKAVDAVRREESLRKRRDAATEQAASAIDDPTVRPGVADEVWANLRRERVREAMRLLPDAQREALALAYFGGYTQREVAALTNTPLGTVKTRMLTGMRRLRDALGGGLLEDGVSV
jgi:RNA polymerase sigma factor (sigma-70 family)